MTAAALGALLSHWRRRPMQLATLLMGLALATALFTGVQAINAEARAAYDRAARAVGGVPLPRLVPAEAGRGVPLETFVALRRAGWLVTPVIEGRLDTAGGSLRLLGIDPFTAPRGGAVDGAALIGGDAEGFFRPPGRLIVAPATAARIGSDGLPPLQIAPNAPPGLAVADLMIAMDLLGREDVDALLLLPGQPLGRPPLAEIAPGLRERPPRTAADISRLTDSFHLNLSAFGLLSFAVGLFIVHGAIGLAFEQRRGLFRTLRALGLPARRLALLAAGELALLATVAGLAGVALGGLVAAVLLPDVAATLRGLYGAGVEGSLSLRPAWWAGGLAMALAGTGLASAGALWQLARLPVLAPARPRAWRRARAATTRVQAAAGAALLAGAAGLLAVAETLPLAFAGVGALLLGAALLLPAALAGALAALARTARGPLSEWFWADTRQQLPGLSLALMALLLALAASIGVGTMVGSFRATFTGWLDQRLAAELYLRTDTEAEADAAAGWLAPRADAVLPILHAETEIDGAPAEIVGIRPHETYRAHWPLLAALPGVWDRFETGTAALVNEQLARRSGLAPGDRLALGPGWEAEVAGIYSDYGNPRAEAMVPVGALAARRPEVERLRLAVRTDRPAELAEGLVREVGLEPGQISDQAAIKALSLRIFERTFAVTGALDALTLAVAGVAMLTALLTLAAMRLPQLAPVWALGLTRARLARLELARALVLAALTAALALPVGLALAWALLARVNVAAFGWRLPMHLFPGDWLALAALALAAAALAAAWPAWRLTRLPPVALLKVFADER